MATRRQRIIEAIRTRMELITVANGYNTDAGNAVYLGEAPDLGEADPDEAIAIFIGDEEIHDGFMKRQSLLLNLEVQCAAVARVDVDNTDASYLKIEDMLQDIKMAMDSDRSWWVGNEDFNDLARGPATSNERESGTSNITCGVAWVVRYHEIRAAP